MTAALHIARDHRPSPPLTFAEAAEALGLDKVSKSPRRMVASLCRRGRLRPIKIGRFVLVAAESVEAYLNGR
jgi:predicted transcriptional regulator of viral defense system